MAEPRFLVIRMGSMGDIVHTLPAVAALRDTFPQSKLDWLVERKWLPLLEGNGELNSVIPIERKEWGSVAGTVKRLRSAAYSTVIDFQGLYKSAALALASGAPRRIGFAREFAREPAAALLYNSPVIPAGKHVVEQNLSLAEFAGARKGPIRFPLPRDAEAESRMARQLEANQLDEFFVLSPGGGWRSKCWPAERYGELHQRLQEGLGWRGIISYGPGEEELCVTACKAAGDSRPLPLAIGLSELMAILGRAKFVVAADTGPLHLAAALGTPVVGLHGPTDPARNGPYPANMNVVVRNAEPGETTYSRGAEYSRAMLSITVDQVVAALLRRLERN
jgi:lipopolysaccharide heptosyltransferase I